MREESGGGGRGRGGAWYNGGESGSTCVKADTDKPSVKSAAREEEMQG